MTIVAILQNQWFHNPESARRSYARVGTSPERRARLVEMHLFMGCLTGKRLRKHFGDLCDQIIWENASKEIGGKPSSKAPYDLDHLLQVLNHFDPQVVLTFGKVAEAGMDATIGQITGSSYESIYNIICPHPAARGADVPALLDDGAAKLAEFMARASL